MLRRQQHHRGGLIVASTTSWSLSYTPRHADLHLHLHHPRAISASSSFRFPSRSTFPWKERFTLLSEISTPLFCSTRWCSARGAFAASSVNFAPSSTSSSSGSSLGLSQNHEQEGFRRMLENENLLERIQRNIDGLEKKRLYEVVLCSTIVEILEESNSSVTLEDVEQIVAIELFQPNSPGHRLLLSSQQQHQQQQKGDSYHPSILYKLLQEPAIVELDGSLQRERYLLGALSSVSITTMFDWVRRSDAEKANAVSDAAARARLDSMCLSYVDKANQYTEKVNQYISQITTDSIKSLLPGSSRRHATVSGHNMKGRSALTYDLSTVLEGFAVGRRDKLPLILLISMPRQGKTLFLDNIGYDRAILEAFVNKPWCGESSTPPCLIFNLTFNVTWPPPTSCSLEEAKQQVCVRLLAAALGIFDERSTDLLQKMASLHRNNITAVADFVVSCVSSALHSSSIGPRQHCVFLFDEITLLSDAIYRFYKENKQYSQQQVDDHVQEFNSCLSALIRHDRAVILSGFNHMQLKLSGSGRPLWSLQLTPATAAQQRRQLHCMKTNFFQRLALLHDLPKGRSGGSDHPIHKAVAVYEFVKSSPGLFGAVLERLASVESAEEFIYFEFGLAGIPFMKKRMSSGSYGDCFIDVLALKAVQFMSTLFDNRSSFSKWASDTLGRAENLSLIQLPSHFRLQSSSEICYVLQSSRLEPLFVSGPRLKAKDVSFLLFRFYTMITCFAKGFVAAKPVQENADLIEVSSLAGSRVDARFGLFDDGYGGVLQGNNIMSPARPRTTASSKKAMSGTVSTRTAMLESAASFFEDSVLMGILLQREFRSRAAAIAISAEGADSSAMRSFTSTVRDWLSGASAIYFSAPTLGYLRIQWSVIQLPAERDTSGLKAASLQLLSSIVQFSGHYPSLPRVKDKHNSKQSQACTSVNGDEHFNVETILVPRRPENNPIAGIIFHEKTIDGELVQFWIDTKHRSQRHHETRLSGNTIARGVESVPTHTVKHVVHIIISPQEIRTSSDFEQVLDSRSNFDQCSYSLFRVNPDDMTHSKAFENLVSQPVALSMPLLEQQLNDSWTQSLPPKNGWCKYKSTRLDSSLLRFLSTEEFTELRSLAFADDCSSLIVNELNDTSEVAREMWQVENCQRQPLLGLPFACMLEAFRLLPRRWNGDCYAIDLRTRRTPALVLSGVARRPRPSSILIGNNSNNNNSSIRDDLMIELVGVDSKGTLSIELSKILRHIKVGHVARFGHKTKQMETSFEYNEQHTMTDLWCRVHEVFTPAVVAAAAAPSIASYLAGDVGMIWSMSLYRVLSFLCVHQNLLVAFGSNIAINTLVQVFGEEKLRKFEDDEIAKAEKQNAADFENDMRQDKALNKLTKSKKEHTRSALKELRREEHPELVANALSILKEEIEAAFEKIVEELKLR